MSTRIFDQPANDVPAPVARVADGMATYRGDWSICGGWAVDAWLGRLTRDHGDVDIAVFQDELDRLFEHLDGWEVIAHDPNVAGNTSERWNGRHLDLPGHIHARLPEANRPVPDRLDDPAGAGFGLDIQIVERSGGDWIFSREPSITAPLQRCVRESAWGLPTLCPEAILFYKASGFVRRRDELDFLALLPHLTAEQRDWLRNAISLVGHRWLPRLSP